MREPAKVVDEMEYLIREWKFKAVYFDDDVFNADKNHVEAICREIIKRKIKIPWSVMARADLMDEDMLKLMAEAGLYAVKYGIESADTDILKNCRKNLDLDKALQVIQKTRAMRIKVHLTFCLGLPGETRATAFKTAEWIKNIRPDSYQMSLATPFPGTDYFQIARKNNWLCANSWGDYDAERKSSARTEALTCEDIERLKLDIDSYINS